MFVNYLAYNNLCNLLDIKLEILKQSFNYL
jgi:hypothetical protein